MQVKKFYATCIDAAMRDIRRTLGPDALILSARPIRHSGIVVNGGPARVEVTAGRPPSDEQASANGFAASDRTMPEAKRGFAGPNETASPRLVARARLADSVSGQTAERPAPGTETRRPKAAAPAPPSNATSGVSDSDEAGSQMLRSVLAELRSLRNRLDGLDGARAPRETAASSVVAPRVRSVPYFAPRRTDCLDASLGDRAASTDSAPGAAIPARVLLDRLRSQGVEETLVSRIVERMYFQGSTRGLATHASEPAGRSAAFETSPFPGPYTVEDFTKAIGDFVPSAPKPANGENGVPRKIALIGPTGVGKTTTIAKLASLASLRLNLRVALATLDTLRVAAADQLRTYAKLLGVPIEVLTDPSHMGRAFERFADSDLILIDTPGYSPRDSQSIDNLARALGAPTSGVEIHLVLTATQRGDEMRRTIERSRPTGFDRLIFSKIDETGSWGDLLNTWILSGYGVSYFTTGQRVPEDLETAAVDRLCRRLVCAEGEEKEEAHAQRR